MTTPVIGAVRASGEQDRPGPIALAEWLLDFQTSGHSAPELSLESYTDPLGERGLAHYGQQVTARWHTAAADDPERVDFQITYLMENWARVRGDVDLLITVLSTNRRYGPAYPQIVHALTIAHRYAASAAQWSRLAGLREPAHPEDAIGVYQRMITHNLVNGGGGYAEAADLAVRIRALYTRIDATEQATAHLTGLRSAHKRKRNFMAELDRRGLP